MSAALIAERYGRALVQTLIEKNEVEQYKNFIAICDIASTHADLAAFFTSAAIKPEAKMGVLDALAQRLGIPATTQQFLKVLAQNRRLDLLPQLKEAVITQVNRYLKVQPLLLTTAVKPSEEEIRVLQQAMAKVLGQAVEVTSKVDETILGGALVQVGSKVFDGSVRGQLERLRKQLVKE